MISLKPYILLLFLMLSTVALYSQERKFIAAQRSSGFPVIDGLFSESEWKDASKVSDFIQYEPFNGAKPHERTDVYVMYNDNALYIAAVMHDVSPDSIFRELGKRDFDNVNADYFAIDLCPFNDGLNGYGFLVTAAGVQVDYKFLINMRDFTWDAVWKSEVGFTDNNWVVEFEIPYSAIRFPKKEVQDWGLNFIRQVRRSRERSSWNFIDKELGNRLIQTGVLKGLKSIESPLRLSLTPYLSGYAANYDQHSSFYYNGGLDLKYGLNESFTMDVTLVPDFGQVQSDDKVLNLSPFETYYGENRPFFTEATELFRKGGIFYSRRIGATPSGYYSVGDSLKQGEIIIKNQKENRLVNATKLSGRTKGGLGVGVFNALTSSSTAISIDSTGLTKIIETQPLTNYNMLVLDQNLRNNSYLCVMNTNVMNRDFMADVGGLEIVLNNKANAYQVTGGGKISSRKFQSALGENGHEYSIGFNKVSGKILFSVNRTLHSNTYNPNDMGYLSKNNDISNNVTVEHVVNNPFSVFISMRNSLSASYYELYLPRSYTGWDFHYNTNATFKNYLSVGGDFFGSPFKFYDYYEPRTTGRYLLMAPYYGFSIWISPDYRKRFLSDFNLTYAEIKEYGQKSVSGALYPRIRLSDKFLIVIGASLSLDYNNIGYISSQGEDIYMGMRDRKTVTNTVDANYIFNNKSSIALRIRHYWSLVQYNSTYLLNQNGMLTFSEYEGVPDINYNAFTVDMSYAWDFAPGSRLSFVWKNNIFTPGVEDLIAIQERYGDNLRTTFSYPQANILSLKILYYLDYQILKK